jgi:GNAT superfamily N-acetyltransferase
MGCANLKPRGQGCPRSVDYGEKKVHARRLMKKPCPVKISTKMECAACENPETPYHRAGNMRIRKAKLADAAVIADFNARMAWETERRRVKPETVGSGVRNLLKDSSKGRYFVAEVERKGKKAIAGQLLITYEWSDWRNGNFWWIQSVYVPEDLRGQGIFRALFEHVNRLARSRKDVCGLRLYVEAQNASAQRTYKRLGMNPTHYKMFETDFVSP